MTICHRCGAPIDYAAIPAGVVEADCGRRWSLTGGGWVTPAGTRVPPTWTMTPGPETPCPLSHVP